MGEMNEVASFFPPSKPELVRDLGKTSIADFKITFAEKFKNAKEEQKSLAYIEKMRKQGEEKFAPYELGKTLDEERIVLERDLVVNRYLDNFRDKPPAIGNFDKRIHILEAGGIKKLLRDLYGSEAKFAAFIDYMRQFVATERSASRVSDTLNIQHELLHLQQPTIFQLIDGEVELYRAGIEIHDKEGKVRLDKLHEVLTEEQNIDIFKRNIENNPAFPLYKEELTIVEKIKPWIKEVLEEKGMDKESQEIFISETVTIVGHTIGGPKEVLRILEDDKTPKTERIAYLKKVIDNHPEEYCSTHYFGYFEDRVKFNKLAEEIISKSGGKLKDKRDVIRMFAEVQYASNDKFVDKFESLKKNIDEILGEGSWEKRVEEPFSTGKPKT